MQDFVKGPIQKRYWNIKNDRTRRNVYLSERHVIKKYRNSQGYVVNIYDTDETRDIDKVYNDYFMLNDIRDMQYIIEGGKVPEEKRTDEFLKRIYEDISYHRVYHRRIDPIYD